MKEWKSGREALAQAAKGQVCFVFGERRQEPASLLDLLEEPGCSRPEEAIAVSYKHLDVYKRQT